MRENGFSLVSVIVGTYNAREFVPATLQSILSQNYSYFELIVVDDASRDETWEFLTSLKDPRLRLYRNKKNLGIPATRNRGLKLAKGKYVTFFDHDDIMLPEAIRKRVEFLENKKEAEAVFGYTKEFIGKKGKIASKASVEAGLRWGHLKFFHLSKVLNFEDVKRFVMVHHLLLQNFVFRRSLLKRTGDFDTRFETADDSDYKFRLAKRTPFYFVNVPVRYYRLHGKNKSCLTPTKRIFQEWQFLTRRYGIDPIYLLWPQNLDAFKRKQPWENY